MNANLTAFGKLCKTLNAFYRALLTSWSFDIAYNDQLSLLNSVEQPDQVADQNRRQKSAFPNSLDFPEEAKRSENSDDDQRTVEPDLHPAEIGFRQVRDGFDHPLAGLYQHKLQLTAYSYMIWGTHLIYWKSSEVLKLLETGIIIVPVRKIKGRNAIFQTGN